MTAHCYAIARIARPAIPPSRTRAEVTADVRAAAGDGIHTVDALIKVLAERIGNPDLEWVLDRLGAIYHAEPSAHYEAAYDLAKAAQDICDDHEIE